MNSKMNISIIYDNSYLDTFDEKENTANDIPEQEMGSRLKFKQ
jgi:hypothetical protein